MTPLISVITATRDRPAELQRAYRSLLAQDYVNWEWIVVDDRSRTPYVAALTGADPRVRAFSASETTGKGPTRNVGLEAVEGAWYTFLDDDDELLPNALSLLRAAAERHGDAPHVYRATLLLQDGTGSRRPAPTFYATGDAWVDALFAIGNIAGYLVPARLSRAVRFRDTRYFQDGDYFLRLACEAEVITLTEPVYVYHRYGPSGSAGGYAARDPGVVLSEELSALGMLFETDHPTIRGHRERGVERLAIAARHIWHAGAFPSVSLWDTARAALSARPLPVVLMWLLRAAYLRLERRWPRLRAARGG